MSDALSPVSMSIRDRVALVVIDNPPLNSVCRNVRMGLKNALTMLGRDETVDAMIITGASAHFMTGEDLQALDSPALAPLLPDLCVEIERSGKPIVAALNGAASGGGFEIALACHARVGLASAQIGLPEVKLGLVPCSGGTQRLPRLIGLLPALDLIANGKTITAAEALASGALDEVVDSGVFEAAERKAKYLAHNGWPRTGARATDPVDEETWRRSLDPILRKARGQIAPRRAAELVLRAASLPLEEGLKQERETFLDLIKSDQSRALRYASQAENEAYKPTRLYGAASRPFERIAVIGAGTMGTGIAVALADALLSVTVIETGADALAKGKDRINSTFSKMVKSRRISETEKDARLARIEFNTGIDAIAQADFIIEAVFEDMQVKQDLFRQMGVIAKPGAVLATNTSYLDIEAIAAASRRTGDVIGLHFFAPAHIMRLVEVIRCRDSATDALSTGFTLARRLGKIPIFCGICDGFVANRILASYRAQAEIALEEGALPHEVDEAMEHFGFPMGPFAVSDLSGLDIAWSRRKRLAATRSLDARYTSRIADRLCALGRFGQKTGAGWYAYANGQRTPDQEVTKLIHEISLELDIKRLPLNEARLQRRLRAAMVNEGAKILGEEIVDRASDIDLAMIHGLGYPAWRGGPMWEADDIGADAILSDVQDLARISGPGWEPAPLLVEMARTGGRFSEWRA